MGGRFQTGHHRRSRHASINFICHPVNVGFAAGMPQYAHAQTTTLQALMGE